MTKKDYLKLAQVAAVVQDDQERVQICNILEGIFTEDNPRYKHNLFMKEVEEIRESRKQYLN